MALFFICVALLIAGYFVYGALVEKIFGIQPDRAVPSQTMADGVDYIPLSTYKAYLIQILNIAGLGPIFGPILGALYGPAAMIWVVIGCIFGGAVHDYLSGMLSIRYDGENMPAVIGRQLGPVIKQIVNVFTVILMVLVGVVFVLGPAQLLTSLTSMPLWSWCAIIFAYYFIATMLPIDKIIGRIYPIFGGLLLFMSVALTIGLIMSDHKFYAAGLELVNTHPKGLPLWPLMFITIACGSISGFHATQSPLMARCMRSEKNGRFVFYGAMIGEGIIGLIWVTLGLSFYDSATALQAAIAHGGPGGVVKEVTVGLLGSGIGYVLSMLGVVALPVTTGDTAFRGARLIIAEYLKMPQGPIVKRLLIAVPMFVIGIILTQVSFAVIWRYFGWANQTLSVFTLWACSAYLLKNGKFHWIASLPAAFMTAVTIAYIANATIGFNLPLTWATWIGVAAAAACYVAFFAVFRKKAVESAAE